MGQKVRVRLKTHAEPTRKTEVLEVDPPQEEIDAWFAEHYGPGAA